MITWSESLYFFSEQILIGTFIGLVLSILGCFVVLRKLSFMGITLSQAATCSVSISLIFQSESELLYILISYLLMLPIVFIGIGSTEKKDMMLAIFFVFYSAFSQVVMSFGHEYQHNLVQAYFGDILTSAVRWNSAYFIILSFSLCLLGIFYNKLLLYSFDPVEYRVERNSIIFMELFFITILTLCLSISVKLLGITYTMAQLLFPSFMALFFVKTMNSLILFSLALSFLTTIVGFGLSLIPISISTSESIMLPSSTVIILVMSIVFIAGLGLKEILQKNES
jgi:iron/zinc/copper transport system permease protein